MPREVSTGNIDRYGRGYHALGIQECPHCNRATERVTLKLPSSGAKARKCPWCSRSLLSRYLHRVKSRLQRIRARIRGGS
jgi:transposase-like protein